MTIYYSRPRKQGFIDLFCGFGGWTMAIKLLGQHVNAAVNHSADALMIHGLNNPETTHYLTNVRQSHPSQFMATEFFIGSPACTDHSQAKIKQLKVEHEAQLPLWSEAHNPKEYEKMVAEIQSRATMWDVVKFASQHDYWGGLIENVVEVHNWVMFDEWCREMRSLGYELEFIYLNSMFFHELNGIAGIRPAPQSRDRWYCCFYKKGLPMPNFNFRPLAPCPECGDVRAKQVWKNTKRMYGKYKQQYFYGCPNCIVKRGKVLSLREVRPYYYAAINAINFELPIMKVGDPNRNVKVSQNSRLRIQMGLDKYGPQPMMHANNKSPKTGIILHRSALINPLYTQTTSHNYKLSLPPAFLHSFNKKLKLYHENPLGTQTTQGGANLILVTDTSHGGQVRSANRELFTQTTSETQGVVAHPQLIDLHSKGLTRDIKEPLSTTTTVVKNGIMLSTFNGTSVYKNPQFQECPTITTIDRVSLHEWYGEEMPAVDDVYYRTLRAKARLNDGTVVSEIRNSMGFNEDFDILGNRDRELSGRAITRGFGGAVTPGGGSYLVGQFMEIFE